MADSISAKPIPQYNKMDFRIQGKTLAKYTSMRPVVEIPEFVTEIGNGAFKDCKTITKVIVPDSVAYIGDDAFCGCESLAEINIPEKLDVIGSHAFKGCGALGSLELLNDWMQIGSGAFDECDGLKSLSAPYAGLNVAKGLQVEALTVLSGQIPNGAFKGLSELKKLVIADGVQSVAQNALDGCIGLVSLSIPCLGDEAGVDDTLAVLFGGVVPSTLKHVTVRGGEIDYEAFKNCTSLETVLLNGVTAIYNSAFDGCTNLKTVAISKSVECVGNYIFAGCPYVNIFCEAKSKPEYWDVDWNAENRAVTWGFDMARFEVSHTSISGFILASSLSDFKIVNGEIKEYKGKGGDVIIPHGVTCIGKYAFLNCSRITSIGIPNSVTSVKDNAFAGCSRIISIEIPNSVTSIGYGAFHECSCLTSIIISTGVTSIGDSAFSDCSKLISIEIPHGVTSIESGAFNSCISLKSINIPSSITNIGEYAFYCCSSLTKIIFNGTKAQWKAIKKGASWKSYAGKFTVQCTDGTLTKAES